MADVVIGAEGLGKKYVIGHQAPGGGYLALRDVLAQSARTLWGRTRDLLRGNAIVEGDTREEFWALRDVSFDVRRGEAVGIIGRNGAGKSTLLKVLSRITEPSAGRVTVRGRVASLLEVGTGFHPELTGRENIRLNGAILGMTRAEVRRKFDEIVAFAEVERFLDTPVKRYSSGMYVRLAFAVAAHLEPEILVVDEVLAVGDAAFQKKCLSKMGDVAGEGRTVLFVSHNLAAVQQLCRRGLLFDGGRLVTAGPIGDTVSVYLGAMRSLARNDLGQRRDRKGSQQLVFTRVAVCDRSGAEVPSVMSGQEARIRFYYRSRAERAGVPVHVAFNVRTGQGHLLANLNSVDTGQTLLDVHLQGYFECRWPRLNLRSGSYDCALFCSIQGEIADWVQSAFVLTVEDGDFYNTGKLADRQHGDILVDHSWSVGALPQPAAAPAGARP